MAGTHVILGCLALLFLAFLTILYAKFLVPVVPLFFAVQYFFAKDVFTNGILQTPQEVNALTPCQVVVESKVEKIGEEILSPYFKENCVGYYYTEIEYISTEDFLEKEVLVDDVQCDYFRDFFLFRNADNFAIYNNHEDCPLLTKIIW